MNCELRGFTGEHGFISPQLSNPNPNLNIPLTLNTLPLPSAPAPESSRTCIHADSLKSCIPRMRLAARRAPAEHSRPVPGTEWSTSPPPRSTRRAAPRGAPLLAAQSWLL
eukprot:NODE_1116_length_2138_cov_0.027464.p4 type:complete len:110 gc:universal NODE_1116_length_2138_cov_0.027464:1076-747(-)